MSAQSAPSATWTEKSVPDLADRVAVITGANTGIGFETARVLAARGATVVLACRSQDKARAAKERIAAVGGGSGDSAGSAVGAVETVPLDLASLASVERAADAVRERHPRIDLLINNAGVMDTPYSLTADGFERQFGTNHLGHFAFTGRLLPGLLDVPGSRVVTVSSIAHHRGSIDLADLLYENGYTRDAAYCRSKLANLLFSFELQRRLEAAGAPTIALAAHPGVARTELPRYESPLMRVIYALFELFVAQSAAMGALPTLRAATDPHATGGEYYGPDGRKEQKGYPVVVSANATACDVDVARRLWAESEKVTGVAYPV